MKILIIKYGLEDINKINIHAAMLPIEVPLNTTRGYFFHLNGNLCTELDGDGDGDGGSATIGLHLSGDLKPNV